MTNSNNLILRNNIPKPEKIVIKIGSKIVSAGTSEEVKNRLTRITADIKYLIANNIKVVLVISGAVAYGMKKLGIIKKPDTIPLKQACASIGQPILLNILSEIFSEKELIIGQVLLTWNDLRNKNSYLNLRNTLNTLLEKNTIPIINENDSVGIEEIKIGDNDTLAAQISLVINADLFVNLTDINGLYTENPRKNTNAKHIEIVENITKEHIKIADGDGNSFGVGGMYTKIKAASIVCKSGINAIIGDGFNNSIIDVLKDPQKGTLFVAHTEKMPARKRWISFTGKAKGKIIVDEGAKKAILEHGKSLLPAGIKKCEGTFSHGELVDIADTTTNTFAKGYTNFSNSEIEKIMGKNSSEIEKILGYQSYKIVVHRNNMSFV